MQLHEKKFKEKKSEDIHDIVDYLRLKTTADIQNGDISEARMFGSNYGKWPFVSSINNKNDSGEWRDTSFASNGENKMRA